MSRPSKKKDYPGQPMGDASHDILDHAPIGVFRTTPEGYFLYANQALARMFGYESPNELIKSVRDITNQFYADSSDREDLMRLLNENGEVFNYECRGICRDGSMVWVSINVNKVVDESGKIYFQYFITDITARKQAEKAEKESDERFRQMFTNAPMPYQSLDEQGNFLDINKTFLDVLGYSREELIGKNFADILHPDWKEHFKKNFPRFKAIGEILGVEFEMVKKDGSTILVYFNGKIQHDDQGRFLRTHCIFQDITELKRIEANLQRQTGLIISLLDSIPDIIFIKDIQGVYLGCNTEFSRHVGKDKEDIIGGTDYDLYPKETANFFRTNDKLMLKQGRPRHNEEWIFYPDGRKILLDTLKTPYRDDQGEVVGIIGVCRDTTDRKQTELALSKSQKIMAQAEKLAGLGSWEWDIKNDTWLLSDNWKRIHGYNQTQLTTSELFTLGHPEDVPAIKKAVAAAIEKDEPYDIEFRIIRQDTGEVRYIHTMGKVEYDGSGQLKVLTGAAQDITDRKRAEEALRASEKIYKGLSEDMPAMICRFLPDLTLTYVNQAYCDNFGKTPEELIGVSFLTLIPEEDHEATKATFATLNWANPVNTFEHQVFAQDGSILWQRWINRALFDDQGSIFSYQSVGEDITDRKKAEEKIKNINQQLEKVNAEKDKLFTIIAHDLKSPMAGVYSTSQILAEEAGSLSLEEIGRISAEMHKSSKNVLGLLNDLMQWALTLK